VRDDDADASEPISLYLLRFSETEYSYSEFIEADGDAFWMVGSNGIFTKSVQLLEGDNKFAIAACKSSVPEAVTGGLRQAEDINDEEIQIVKFTITYRTQNVAEKIGEVVKELSIVNILNELEKK
jgi:hypothetical protein